MIGTEKLQAARPGNLVTLHEEISASIDAAEYFTKISDYGKKPDSLLFESADIITKYGEKSIGSANPCIKVRGRDAKFEIIALNDLGKKFLASIKDDFSFCESVKFSSSKISGKLESRAEFLSESERLRQKTHADILRAVAFKFVPVYKPFAVCGGLMGAIAYDFIDQFEKLPKNKKDVLNEPDYEMNFYDNIFIADHKNGKLFFVANALIFNEEDKDSELARCLKIIENYKTALGYETFKKNATGQKISVSSDTSKEEFIKIVKELKQNILAGDIFQAVVSRTLVANYSCEPFDAYVALRSINPSPYMFYFNTSTGIIVGSSPETFLKVEGEKKKRVEIRPIAGTKPRGIVNGEIDQELDGRYEAQLKNDKKELAEHTMLIDLARNDVARVCEAGSRICEMPYSIEKYSHVQHLVSKVSGILKPDLDALHAYLASMNMGTLTGAPKVEAMKLLRQKEKTRRGFYGGSIGYLTPSRDFDSAIIIRSIKMQKGKAYVRAGAGIVFDSDPQEEFLETQRKAQACIAALETAQRARK